MTQTVLGLIAFWLFTALMVKPADAPGKRFNHGLMLYLYLNMLTSVAIFTIKVSAPIFLIAGYLCYRKASEDAARENMRAV